MSGICGVVVWGSQERFTAEGLAEMCQGLGPGGTPERLVLNEGRVGLGARPFPGYGAHAAEIHQGARSLGLVFHGNLYPEKDGADAGASHDPAKEMLERYLVSGTSFLPTLRGEFALALWDSGAETLHVATDRFRVNPVIYGGDSGRLLFASRMRAIERAPIQISRTILDRALVDVLVSSAIPTPDTIYREFHKLPPGCLLTCRRGEVSVETYWDIDFRAPSKKPKRELAEEVRDSLRDAVAVRLHADGGPDRVGAFLSGGIDSSTVTGLMTQIAGRPIRSFTIGFGEERFNEMSYARIAARAFGAEHHEYFVSPKDTAEALPIVVDEFDEPFGNASAVPTYFCAKMAKEHGVSVMYAGDGGDELFGGNDRYSFNQVFDYWTRVPAFLREPLLKPSILGLARALPFGVFSRAGKYVDRASLPVVERMVSYDLLHTIPLHDLMSDATLARLGHYDAARMMSFYYEHALGTTHLDRHLYLDLKVAIADNDLFKVNRMTESAGVAVRYPFLDARVADAAARVPAALKMRGRKLRVFFKDAYRDLLPPEVIQKTKHGFGLPISIWLRTDPKLNGMMQDLVLGPRSLSRGYFRRATLERMIAEHRTDETSFYGDALWNLMVLELWHRRHRDA